LPHPVYIKDSWTSQAAKPSETFLAEPSGTLNINTMTKKETAKFVIQLIASIASAILTALGATSCVGA